MATKLTLRLDEHLILTAKSYALRNKTSLSRMIATYFKSLLLTNKNPTTISPLVQEISGIVPKATKATSLAKEYRQHLQKKYQ